ncbi:MAG: N-acetylmuramoyl-L-alanine amidase [Planctomycetes bacterium]|nr:N-acetylmuramoyl-L-alanine amidase [Planctomycetota bacterium]
MIANTDITSADIAKKDIDITADSNRIVRFATKTFRRAKPRELRASLILILLAGLCLLAGMGMLGCSATRPTISGQPTEPPPSYKTWDKLTWLENQLNEATDVNRPELLARMAELYVSAERPDNAATRAREAMYSVIPGGERSNSITSRARTVLGAVAILKNDFLAARRELDLAGKSASDDLERGSALALLAIVEEREQNPTLARVYRQRIVNAGADRIVELTRAIDASRELASAAAMRTSPANVKNIADSATPAPGFSGAGFNVVPRERWNPARLGTELEPMGTPRLITVHHEGKEFNGTTLDDSLRQIRSIQDYHLRGRHWSDIAYHFVIDRLGNVIQGRELKYQGAHAGEKNKKGESPNAKNIGISLLGNYDVQQPTAAQTKALKDLVAYLRKTYNIAQAELYTHGEIKQKYKISGTDCPGRYLRTVVEQLRRGGLASGASVEAGRGFGE